MNNLRDKLELRLTSLNVIERGFALANRLLYFELLRAMSLKLDDVDPRYLDDTEFPYDFRLLTAAEIESFAKDEANDLHSYCQTSIANGDLCFGVLDGDRLASYGWYSKGRGPITGEFGARCDDHYYYMTNGFTHPDYRGKRLHASGMGRSLQWLSQDKDVELVSVVSISNSDSYKSTQRLGYRDFGRIWIGARFNTYVVYLDRSSVAKRFWVEPTSDDFRTVFLRKPPAIIRSE